MSRTRTAKQKRLNQAGPALRAVGAMSVLLAGVPPADANRLAGEGPPDRIATQKLMLSEEEIVDVSLSTFYVFDKESAKPRYGDKVAWWWGCRACRGCGCGAAVAPNVQSGCRGSSGSTGGGGTPKASGGRR
jgi:hypothetical protein